MNSSVLKALEYKKCVCADSPPAHNTFSLSPLLIPGHKLDTVACFRPRALKTGKN